MEKSEVAALGRRIQDARTAKGWTQPMLAERADVSKGYVSKLEKGKGSRPSATELRRVLEVLGLNNGNVTAVVSTPDAVAVPVVAEASAGRGPGYRLPGEPVLVPKAEAGNRALIAVKVVGDCMRDNFKPDDLVIFEKVNDGDVNNGDIVCVTVRGRGENGAYLIKYLAWDHDNESVVLTADDGTRLKLPYEDVIIEGRYFDLRRPRAAGR